MKCSWKFEKEEPIKLVFPKEYEAYINNFYLIYRLKVAEQHISPLSYVPTVVWAQCCISSCHQCNKILKMTRTAVKMKINLNYILTVFILLNTTNLGPRGLANSAVTIIDMDIDIAIHYRYRSISISRYMVV